MPDSSVERLAAFVNRLDETLGWQFDVDEFDDRVRIQKYVNLADAFGFEHPYEYGMHLHGPYSPALAKDYYSETFGHRRERVPPLAEFDAKAFRDLVADKDREWLEVAATIKSLDERFENPDGSPTRDAVLDRVTDLKDISRPKARSIYRSLAEAGVLTR